MAQAFANSQAEGTQAPVAGEETPKLKRKEYEEELRKLQTELCSLQDWVKATGERIIVIFEGRDAAGKGGTIRALTERVSPRMFGSLRCQRPPTARSRRSICSVTSRTFRRPVRS